MPYQWYEKLDRSASIQPDVLDRNGFYSRWLHENIPETRNSQGIFVNYLNVQKTGRMRIPFGIAQIGKAFRNEIVARQFIFRMREFEQMEMHFSFVRRRTQVVRQMERNASQMA